MIDHDEILPAGGEPHPVLLELTEEITRRLQDGETVDAADFIHRYPQWAGAIRKLLPTMSELAVYGRLVNRDRGRQQRPVRPDDVLEYKP